MYKPGGTIRDAIKRIEKTEYVLPAIQREFVWKPEQIARLFDSLMRGYPFGTFLFWRVEAASSGKYRFYGFVREYHQRDAPHCPELGLLPDQALTAVLDGQQRLTALNIGLRGSMAVKEPNKWWNNTGAFPRKCLHLDLLSGASADDDGARYGLRFLEPAKTAASTDAVWFPVADVLGMQGGPGMLGALMARGLEGDALMRAYKTLDRLHDVVHKRPLISYYEEESQNLDRVLNIFIRLNSGGTVLSYSDLLLSIAVAQWSKLDARKEIHGLVDELNEIGCGFGLSQDFVLKAGLMLADIASVGFKVENFDKGNMARLEADWPAIKRALRLAVQLAAGFGLDGQTLRADSALLPIAYYLHRRNPPDGYLTNAAHAPDRAAVRDWLVRSLLKPSGVWGSGLDTLLTALRDVLKSEPADAFPTAALRRGMAQRGKPLTFEPEEVQDLLDAEYGDRRTFLLLSLLYPFVDLRNQFHVDHVFPRSRLTPERLRKAGLPEDGYEAVHLRRDRLANLQLLEGGPNQEKAAKLPAEWLEALDPRTRQNHCALHDLGEVPAGLDGFEAFYDARRARLAVKVTRLLGARAQDAAPPPPA